MALEMGADSSHLRIGDFDALGVGALVELGVHAQACAGGGGADEVDDDFTTGEWLASPVGF